jgi:3-oxoacyl-[acyl-carrier-protein] synthase II
MAARKTSSKPVAVTGIGIITSLGRGREENWAKLSAGASGIHAIDRFSTEGLRTTISGSVDFMEVDPVTMPALSLAMADAVIAEAFAQAGLTGAAEFPGSLFIAAPPIEHDWVAREFMAPLVPAGEKSYYARRKPFAPSAPEMTPFHVRYLNGTIADELADKYGCQGSPITLTTACASGATAIQLGVEAIRSGEAPAALSVGTDGSIQEETLIRFSLLSALSTKNDSPQSASRPFSKNRDGFVMAEGAAALVLEDPDHAKARGAPILGYILGCGEGADSFHRTRSNPNGHAIMHSIAGAIEDAGLSPSDIGYVNAHGTGTPENDKMEYLGISTVLGDHTDKVAVSSNKSMIGHTLSAAGAVEAAFTLLTLRDGLLPPTINHDVPDPNLPIDVVPNVARKQQADFALSNSFGFGGQNVSLVLARGD